MYVPATRRKVHHNNNLSPACNQPKNAIFKKLRRKQHISGHKCQSSHNQLGRTSFAGSFTSAVSKYSIRSSFSSLFLRLPVKRRYSSSVLERFQLYDTRVRVSSQSWQQRDMNAYPCRRRRQPMTVPVRCRPMAQQTRIGKFSGLIICYPALCQRGDTSTRTRARERGVRNTSSASVIDSTVIASQGAPPSWRPRW